MSKQAIFAQALKGWLSQPSFIDNIVNEEKNYFKELYDTHNSSVNNKNDALKISLSEFLNNIFSTYCKINLSNEIYSSIFVDITGFGFGKMDDSLQDYFQDEIIPELSYKLMERQEFKTIVDELSEVVDINYIDEPEDLVGNKFKLISDGDEKIIKVIEVSVENNELEIRFIDEIENQYIILMEINEFEFLKENDSVDLTINDEEITFSFI